MDGIAGKVTITHCDLCTRKLDLTTDNGNIVMAINNGDALDGDYSLFNLPQNKVSVLVAFLIERYPEIIATRLAQTTEDESDG